MQNSRLRCNGLHESRVRLPIIGASFHTTSPRKTLFCNNSGSPSSKIHSASSNGSSYARRAGEGMVFRGKSACWRILNCRGRRPVAPAVPGSLVVGLWSGHRNRDGDAEGEERWRTRGKSWVSRRQIDAFFVTIAAPK